MTLVWSFEAGDFPNQYLSPSPLRMILTFLYRLRVLDDNCWKNLGRTGEQPTIMPIAISAKLEIFVSRRGK